MRMWAAVKLVVLAAVLGAVIGSGAGLGASALYRWGEGQSAAKPTAAVEGLATPRPNATGWSG